MMVRMAILAGVAAASLIPSSGAALAQAAPAAAEAKIDGRAVVADVRKIIAANYVLPDVRPKLDAALAKGGHVIGVMPQATSKFGQRPS